MISLTRKVVSSVTFVMLSFPVFANVVLTDDEYSALLQRLKADKKLLATENIRWEELKKSQPKITYEVVDDQVVIQTIEIPIYNSKPLIYEVKFVVEKKENLKWVPWTFQLCGLIETNYSVGEKFNIYPDIKLGVRFFSTAPAGIKFLNLGFNALVGIRSAGLSLSYSLPKPLKNTSLHFFLGVSYTAKVAYGFGISLNF